MSVNEKMTAIADAIRAKTGDTEALTLDDMAEAIASIETGGGDSGLLGDLVGRTVVDFSSGDVTLVGASAFNSCTKLVTVSIPNATRLGGSAFAGCSALKSVYAPKVTAIDGYAFNNCKAIERFHFESAQSIGIAAFQNCTSLKIADFPSLEKIVGGNVFKGCSTIMAVIIRSSEVAYLSTAAAFTDSAIASGTGYIYVPAALIEEYKATTNWSTHAAQFRALEDYTVDGTITGELDETKIAT